MDIRVVEEGGLFRVYVDRRAILGLLTKTEAEKLANFLRKVDKENGWARFRRQIFQGIEGSE